MTVRKTSVSGDCQHDWFLRGTVRVSIGDTQSGQLIDTTIDYRIAGSRPSIPNRIDTSGCMA